MIQIWFTRTRDPSRFARFLRLLLRGPTHVIVGDQDAAICVRRDKTVYWPHFVMKAHPGLVAAFRLHGGVDWNRTKGPRRFPWFRIVARTLTRGRVCAPDCLGITLDVLRREGYSPPRSIVTPKALMEWCIANPAAAVRCRLPSDPEVAAAGHASSHGQSARRKAGAGSR